MTKTIYDRRESEARSYCRSFPTSFTTAQGSTLNDAEGNSYIDFLAGCSSLNYGHNDPDMKAALIDHIAGDGIAHALDMHTDAKADFLTAYEEKILKPRGMDYKVMMTGPTGTNAVEAAIKLARKVTGRSAVINFTNAFIAKLAKKHGALLIVDDIQAGCGRTGTFRGNTHAFVTARVAIEKFWSDKAFEEELAHKATLITTGLQQLADMIPGATLKGRGLMQGVDVGSGELAGEICARAFEQGLIIETSGAEDEVVKVLAPLTTTDAEFRKGFDILTGAAASILETTKIAAE